MNYRHFLTALMLLATCGLSAQTQLTPNEMNSHTTISSGSVIGIHDPSVVYKDGTYTIWGTHLGVAQSKDLVEWTGLSANGRFVKLASQGAASGNTCNGGEAFSKQQVKKVKGRDGQMVDIPNFDGRTFCSRYGADNWIYGNMWAPDIIYNTTMKKWCMYMSLNGDHWASAIVMLTGNSPLGPFTYQAPIVMGGFNDQTYNGVQAPKIGETDYTLVTGETSIPARYRRGDWGTYWPNCIDPCVFYDEEGQLWMSYGSWSGGIFLLKLDNETGLRDYTCHYENDYDTKGANFTSDPYFGKRIAGGYYVSGEGSYIQHIGEYYYLFVVYGGLESNKGYEMRIFRSKTVDGPYKDASGNTATYTGYQMNYGPRANTDRGMRLMSAYNHWGEIQNVGERAQGHNSAYVDSKGRAFVVYHTRFKDGNESFQDRVHQLFVNQNGWLVTAPFAYRGEEQTDETLANGCPWTKEELAGNYKLLLHPYRQDHDNEAEATPVNVTLTPDGKVTGDMAGTWKLKDGTSQMTITVGAVTYTGVFCQQHLNGATTANYKTSKMEAIAFTAVANNGVPVWGYKMAPKSAVAWNYTQNTVDLKDGQTVSTNIKLLYPTTHNAKLSWMSSEPAIISETGKYNPTGLTEAAPVTLTGRLECGDYYWEQAYNVKARSEVIPTGDFKSGMAAYYSFNEKPISNLLQAALGEEADKASLSKAGSGKAAVLEDDFERDGTFVHQYFGAQGSNSFCRMPNPLLDNDTIKGFTVSAWMKRNDANLYDALWCFFNSTVASNKTSPRLFLTGNSFVGYHDGVDSWFDINHPEQGTYTNIPTDEWALVTLTVGPENGVRLYVNGVNKVFKTLGTSYSIPTSGTLTNKIKGLPVDEIVKAVASLKYFNLGFGSFWGSADACFDDLIIYARELTASDVSALKTMSNRVYDFSKTDETGIASFAADGLQTPDKGIFDLSGRRITTPTQRGIYIKNGKKFVR